MYRSIITIVFTTIILLFSCVYAQENNPDTGLEWNGYLQTDNRVVMHDEGDFSWQEYRLGLKGEVNPVEKAHFIAKYG